MADLSAPAQVHCSAAYGLSSRMARLRLPGGGYLIAVLDDGFVSGPTYPAEKYTEIADIASQLGYSAVMGYPGLLRNTVPAESTIARVVNVSGSTTMGNVGRKTRLHRVSEAVRLGADAVAIHISLGVAGQEEMLTETAETLMEAHRRGIAVLAAAYARDHNGDPIPDGGKQAHAARCAAELGANLIKAAWPGSRSELEKVVEAALSIPVLVAGGSPTTDDETVALAKTARSAGAAGVCVGRRLLASPSPETLMNRLLDAMAK
jgi:DhnA family fructose-bisphosphate aldolase class Ia